jgi:2-hydroxy-3-keto-5-methylthiopentenyl-1-phosphate phosphatase
VFEPNKESAIFVDFDNTISCGDVLNSVIEEYSRTSEWMRWQDDWREGRISTIECLQRQVGNLEVTREDLLARVRQVDIDPGFASLQQWAARTGTYLAIASDNFDIIVRAILEHHGIVPPPLFANALDFEGSRPLPSFPYRSATCPRCANCKGSHFAPFKGREIVYVGDGLSDVCPALRADRVYAKDALAEYLSGKGVAYLPFRNLGDVVEHLTATPPRGAGPRPLPMPA